MIRGNCWRDEQYENHPNGYSMITVEGRATPGHRLSYELFVGPIPEGLELDHLCRVKGCYNPDHLEAVTHQENTRRRSLAKPLKTHCKRGHELPPPVRVDGLVKGRPCKVCIAEWRAKTAHKKKG